MRRMAAALIAIGCFVGCTDDNGGPPAASGGDCPPTFRRTDRAPDPDGPAQSGPDFDELARMEPMLGVVLADGQTHSESFASYGLAWSSASDASVFVGHTGDVDGHRERIEALVEFPDELIVCRAVLNEVDSRALEAEILSDVLAFTSVGRGLDGVVDVGLPPGRTDEADALLAQHDELVRLTVGGQPYPMTDPLPASTCAEVVGTSLDGLSITIDPLPGPLTVDGDGQVAVRLRNEGSESIAFMTGFARAVIVETGTRTEVSGYPGGIVALGIGVNLAAGEEQVIDGVTGLAPCDPADGHRVPAGEYELIAVLQGPDPSGPPLLSDPLPIVVA